MFHLEDSDQACTGFPDDDIIIQGQQISGLQTGSFNKVFQSENSNQSCLDLYSDFLTHDHQQQQESTQELKDKLASTKEKITHLQDQLEKIVTVAETLTAENKTLVHNISLLHATARLELKRKDTTIQLLRKRLSGHRSYTRTSSLITSRLARNNAPKRSDEIHHSVETKDLCVATDNIEQSRNAHASPSDRIFSDISPSKPIDDKDSKLQDYSSRDVAHFNASSGVIPKDQRSKSRDRDASGNDATNQQNSLRSQGDKSNHSHLIDGCNIHQTRSDIHLTNRPRTDSPYRHAPSISKSPGESSFQRRLTSDSPNGRQAQTGNSKSGRGDQTRDSSRRHALDHSISYSNSSKCIRPKIDSTKSRRPKKVNSTHVESERDFIKSRAGSHDPIKGRSDSRNKIMKDCSNPIESSEDNENLSRSRRESPKPISVIGSRRASLSPGRMKSCHSNPNESSSPSMSDTDSRGHQAEKDSHGLLARKDSNGFRARSDSPGRRSKKDHRARRDSSDHRARRDSSDHRARRESPCHWAIGDSPGYKATGDCDRTRRDSSDHRARKESPGHRARRESPSHWAIGDSPGYKATGDCDRTRRDSSDHRARKESPGHRARRESPSHWAIGDSPDYKATGDCDRTRDSSDHRARRDSSDHRTRRDSPDHRARRDSPDHRAKRDSPDHRARRDSPDHRAKRDSPDHRARRDSPDHRARRDSPDHRERKDSHGARRDCPNQRESRDGPDNDHMAIKDGPCYAARGGSPGHMARRDSPDHMAKMGSPGHRAGKDGHCPRERRDGARGDNPSHTTRRDSPSYKARKVSPCHRARRDSPGHMARMGSPGHMARMGSPGHMERRDSPGHMARRDSHKPITSNRASSDHKTIRDRFDHSSSRGLSPQYLSSRRESPNLGRSRHDSPNPIRSRNYSRSPTRLKEDRPKHRSRRENYGKNRSPKDSRDKIELEKGSPDKKRSGKDNEDKSGSRKDSRDKHILRKYDLKNSSRIDNHKNSSINISQDKNSLKKDRSKTVRKRSFEKDPCNRSRASNDTKLHNPAQSKLREHSQRTTRDGKNITSKHKGISLDKSRLSKPKPDTLTLKDHRESISTSSSERRTRDGKKIIALKSRKGTDTQHKLRLPSQKTSDDHNQNETKSKNVNDLRVKLQRSRMKAKAHSHSRMRRHSADQENSREKIETLKKKQSVHANRNTSQKIATVISKRVEANVENHQGHKRKASDESFVQSSKKTHLDVEIADADTSEANDVFDKIDQSEPILPINDVEATEVTSTVVVSTPDSSLFFEDSMDSNMSGLDSLLAAKRDILASLNKSFSPQLSDTSDRIIEANIAINNAKPVVLSDNSRKRVTSPDNSISSSDVRTVVIESKDEHLMQESSIADREASRDSIFECDVLCYTEEDMDEADRLCMSETQYSDDCELSNNSNSPHIAPNDIDFEEGEICSDS